MLVKKLGQALVLKTRLYRPFYRIAPLLMLLAPFLLYFTPLITETYEFQEPILKTKLFTLNFPNNESSFPASLTRFGHDQHPLFISIIRGRLSYESVVLASDCFQSGGKFRPFQDVFYNLKYVHHREKQIAKNVVFVCYQQESDLSQLFEDPNVAAEIGIIRVAIVVKHDQRAIPNNSTKRIYFERYTKDGLYPDLDYFQALKELLTSQQADLQWQPCQGSVLAFLPPKIKKWGQLFVRQIYCQAKSILFEASSEPAHSLLIRNGIQSSTLLLSSSDWPSYNSISTVLYSFIEEFSVTESHLHSSSTIYYPLNNSQYIPIKAHLLPGIVYVIITAIYLVIKATYLLTEKEFNLLEMECGYVILASAYCVALEWYWLGSVFYCFWGGVVVRLLMLRRKQGTKDERELMRILLGGISVMMIEFLSIFCLPLSLVLIFLTNITLFTSPALLRRVLGLCFVAFFTYYQLSHKVFPQLSSYTYFILFPLSLWITVP